MPVDYLHLQHQIKKLAATAVTRSAELAHKLLDCQALLQAHANDLSALQKAVEDATAQNKGLRCAKPVNESLTTRVSAVLPAPACTIIAADGSQINPDPHGSALFGLINVGIFTIRPGSGKTPTVEIQSQLLYDQTLETETGLASEELIALMRDVRERQILAEQIKGKDGLLITLTDGPLELYHEPRQEAAFKSYFNKYLAALDDLALEKTITAGYVDRPRASLVVRLLELMAPDTATENPFGGVTDLALYEKILQPGERSAVFKLQSSSAHDYTNKKELHFFYLNVGSETNPSLARVEVPLWVVEDESSLSLLQSVLVEQARSTGAQPYPYPLVRAHETAVVKTDDRQQVTEMIERELISSGMKPVFNSNKQSHKF